MTHTISLSNHVHGDLSFVCESIQSERSNQQDQDGHFSCCHVVDRCTARFRRTTPPSRRAHSRGSQGGRSPSAYVGCLSSYHLISSHITSQRPFPAPLPALHPYVVGMLRKTDLRLKAGNHRHNVPHDRDIGGGATEPRRQGATVRHHLRRGGQAHPHRHRTRRVLIGSALLCSALIYL